MTTTKSEGHVPPLDVKVYSSLDDIFSNGATDVEYAYVDGFKPGHKFRIGSVTAGDMIEWSEANEGEAKKTAGLRLITKSVVDDKGNRILDDDKNIPKLRAMRHKDTERIVKAILVLNGMNVKSPETEAKKD